ncbi:MAG: response regulator [Cyanobacteria bacterium P01_D01_bin.1]
MESLSDSASSDSDRKILSKENSSVAADSESKTSEPETSELEPLNRLSLDLDFNEIPSELSMLNRSAESEEKADESLNALLATVNVTGPEVGSEELNNLASLFDGDLEELDNTLGGHAFVSEEMRLNPESIDSQAQDDLADLLAQSPPDGNSSPQTEIQTEAAEAEADEDLFGGTLTNEAFATESTLEFDGFVEEDAVSLTEDVWGEIDSPRSELDKKSKAVESGDTGNGVTKDSATEDSIAENEDVESEVDTLFGTGAEDLFGTAEPGRESAQSKVIPVNEEKGGELELPDGSPEWLSNREPLTADEITAQGTASSETLSAGLFSSQPVSPSELEIEFPTLTGVKLKAAEEDIDSFFFGDDASQRDEQVKQVSSQAAVEEGEDSLLEEFGVDGSSDRKVDSALDEVEPDDDLGLLGSEAEDSADDIANDLFEDDTADDLFEDSGVEDVQISDDPWDEISFEPDAVVEAESATNGEQLEVDSFLTAPSAGSQMIEDFEGSAEEVFESEKSAGNSVRSLDTLSLGLEKVDVDPDTANADTEEDELESLFSAAETASVPSITSVQSDDDWNANETASGGAFDLDFGILDDTSDVDGLLPEDLIEFEEAFGKNLESPEVIDDSILANDLSEGDLLENNLSELDNFSTDVMPEESQAISPVADANEVDTASEVEKNSSTDDLSIDDLLGLASSSNTSSSNASSSSISSSNVAESEIRGEATATTDGFDDLELLLSEGTVDAPVPAADSALDLFEADDEDDNFEDLERLLKDGADEHISPAPKHRPSPKSVQRTPGIREQNMRVPVKHLDNLSNLVGELVVSRNTLERDQERLRQFLDNLLFQVQQLNDVGQRMRDLYERSLLESSLVANRRTHAANNTLSEAEDHATGAIFDALEMDRFTGFHTLSQEMIELIVRVRESASDIGYTIESSDQITRQFRQVTTQLQEGLNTARMVPFSQASARLPRAIRDISLRCGKEAGLVIEGEDTLIDKMIVESLYDPLTHLVNNAITHGIETPEQRRAAGKPPEGKITIKAFYQGNQTVIYVSDDGRGIDPELIKRKAIEKRLIRQSEADELTDVEAYALIFLAGFSTRDQADDFAGRGVGMDVVRTALEEIRGVITTDSELGRGTSFTIRLPLTLSISKALSCVSNQARIAFPMDGVEDMLDVGRDRILKNDQDQDCVLWREVLLPIRPVTDLLKFNRTLGRGRVYGGSQDDDILSIIVLRSANTFVALQVDQVIGEEEIVIKQLEGPVPKPLGIAGATILGDGRVMPIADVLELIDIATGRVRREPVSMLWSEAEATVAELPAKSDPTVLIVDDSITVRELLSMSFNKVGYRVEQARDGQEAWDKLRSGLPCDLVFCDIEMPRMDGLELLSRMQKDSHLKQIPIAMLTSRGADRHRQMAVDLGASGYFTKPYLEEALLDAAQRMLNGELLEKGRGG